MGDEIVTGSFSKADFERFRRALQQETTRLASWFEQQCFSTAPPRAGFELEAWLLDEELAPAPINDVFLQKLNSPLASPELASFNIELNSTPCDLQGDVLSHMQAELDANLRRCKQVAAQLHSDILMTGILPTLDNDVLHLANMSNMKRYRALNREVLHRRRGKPLVFDINGVEHLKVTHRDVMMEAAATSFQIHLQVNLDNAVRLYNASIAVCGPLLALSANSPYLFGKDLWDETRIPVFEQAVAVGGYDGAAFGPVKRVTFGDGYVRESLFECFHENLEHYPVLLPVQLEDDNSLPHLRLHNGTIWRWVRPLIGFDERGKPHLRIEQRVVPAGPCSVDAIANAAFYYGLVMALAQGDEAIETQLPHERARDNFYAAARHGLRSTLRWRHEQDINAAELILQELLPLARQGLDSMGISKRDSSHYLGIIRQRVSSGQNGAQWQRRFVAKHGRDMYALTRACLRNQNSGSPVHEWHVQNLDAQASRLQVLDALPAGLLQTEAQDLQALLQQPTLIRLPGRRDDVLFVSVLLHGNETSGWDALRSVLQEYEHAVLPRSLYLLIGNVAAAAEGVRVLDGQQDFNRIWKAEHDAELSPLAGDVMQQLEGVSLFAAIDIHNNTGINPHYACVNELQPEFLHLATLFSRTVVYFRHPDSVLSMQMSRYCPAVTVECGKSGDKRGIEHAREFVHACLHLQAFPAHAVAPQDVDVFQTVATVKIRPDADFAIDTQQAGLNFIANMDRLNFQELPAGTVLAHIDADVEVYLQALDDDGNDRVQQYFVAEQGLLRFARPLMPSMLTLDEKIIRQDCLCYLMERVVWQPE